MARHFARVFVVAAGLAAVVSSAAPAWGYTWYRVADGAGPPLRWFRTALTYRVSTVAPQELAVDALPELFADAFGAWDGLPGCAVPQASFEGATDAVARTVPRHLSDPPDNVVVFIPTAAAWAAEGHAKTWIAITSIAHDTRTGEIVDADIEVNDGDFVFSAGAGPPDDDHIDFASTMTHEVGHFFGLDHSLDPIATMFATYARDDDPTGARTLAVDDIDGVCALYADVPPHVTPTPPGEDEDPGCGGGAASAWGLAYLGVACARRRRRRRRQCQQR